MTHPTVIQFEGSSLPSRLRIVYRIVPRHVYAITCLITNVPYPALTDVEPLLQHTHLTTTPCMYVCMYVWSSHIAEYGSPG